MATQVESPARELRQTDADRRLTKIPPVLLRYGVAFVFLLYGFAKLLGSQFTILDSELDRPMGQVSGMWLTWYYFGFSPVYGNLIGLAQVAGALLLTFRKTTLLGICLLLPITTNIVLVDVFYEVDLSGTLMAIFMWCCLLAMLGTYREPLVRLVQSVASSAEHPSKVRVSTAWAARIGMVMTTSVFIYWIANYNNRSPTPVDGTWDVEVAASPEPASLPKRIYFERNRAHLVIFRYADHWTAHHFEVNPETGEIRIWEEWLSKGRVVFQGRYRLQGNQLELRGRLEDALRDVSLHLDPVHLARRGRPPHPARFPTSEAQTR
jgi:hypothetical protein